MRILVTGGAGFIGSALVRRLIERTEHSVLNIDKLTYAASPASLAAVEASPRYAFREPTSAMQSALAKAFREFRPDAVMHLAAESHVDRSIDGAGGLRRDQHRRHAPAARSGARTSGRRSTPTSGRASASTTSRPTRSSARSERTTRPSPRRRPTSRARPIRRARRRPTIWCAPGGTPTACRCSSPIRSNNYGPYHFPEKLIPLTIVKAIRGEALPVYGRGENVRDWLHVEDHAEALVAVVERGRLGETYFIGGDAERKNIDVVTADRGARRRAWRRPSRPAGKRADLISFVSRPAGPRFPLRDGHLEDRPRARLAAVAALRGRAARRPSPGISSNSAWWTPLIERYAGERLGAPKDADCRRRHEPMRVLVFGSTGQVARALSRTAWPKETALTFLDRSAADLSAPERPRRDRARRTRPTPSSSPPATRRSTRRRRDEATAHAVNAAGPAAIAQATRGALEFPSSISPPTTSSTAQRTASTTRTMRSDPLNAYGRSKAAGEAGVRAANPRHLILRTSWVYSAHGANFLTTMLKRAKKAERGARRRRPAGLPDRRRRSRGGDREGASGARFRRRPVRHLPCRRQRRHHMARLRRGDLRRASGARASAPADNVPIATADYPTPARRPAEQPAFERALRRGVRHRGFPASEQRFLPSSTRRSPQRGSRLALGAAS